MPEALTLSAAGTASLQSVCDARGCDEIEGGVHPPGVFAQLLLPKDANKKHHVSRSLGAIVAL